MATRGTLQNFGFVKKPVAATELMNAKISSLMLSSSFADMVQAALMLRYNKYNVPWDQGYLMVMQTKMGNFEQYTHPKSIPNFRIR